MNASCWIYSRADRLAAARDHADAIRKALMARRCDAVHAGDRHDVALMDNRLAVTVARYRRLGRLARAERYASRSVHA